MVEFGPVVKVQAGEAPLVLGMPHVGQRLPDSLFARLNANGQRLSDTDWHIDRLYRDLVPDATVVQAEFHRYVIDANRDPQQLSLYPGQNTTALCPETDFDNQAIWQDGETASDEEIAQRLDQFHARYHETLQKELDRVRAEHGFAILFDCHSIRSDIPWLFEGELPAFNIGTNDGATCDPQVEQAVTSVLCNDPRFSSVVNGRFKGGFSTRHYGQPALGVHAIQLEMAQRVYMTESDPFPYQAVLADEVRLLLSKALHALIALTPVLREKADS